jgi:Bifunctional DNA primase/polymerase, N-terminal/Protein of unknown function (DUF3987)
MYGALWTKPTIRARLSRGSTAGGRSTAREYATEYAQRGYSVVPVKGKKPWNPFRPDGKEWQKLRLTPEQLPKVFNNGYGIGLLLGPASNNLIDVDLDSPNAVRIAPYLLPKTGMHSGRHGKPNSHWWYACDPTSQMPKYADYINPIAPEGEKATIVELRATDGSVGRQTVVPPSLHVDTGEPITWESFDQPALVDGTTLQRQVARVAAGALLMPFWKQGYRHKMSLALAGALLRHGWSEPDTTEFICAIAQAVGYLDEDLDKIADNVIDTAERLEDELECTGIPELATYVDDPKVLKKSLDWLGIRANRQEAIPHYTPPQPKKQPVLGEDALHGVVGDVFRAAAPNMETNAHALVPVLLQAVGNMIGHRVYFMAGKERHYTSLYTCLVGETSDGKNEAWSVVRELLRKVDPDWLDSNVLSGLSSGQGIVFLTRDNSGREDEVGNSIDDGVQDKRLMFIEKEFSSVLKLMTLSGSVLSNMVRQAWDDGNIGIANKNSPMFATGAHLAIHGQITPVDLENGLTHADMSNGFGNRFLWCVVKFIRELPRGGNMRDLSPEAKTIKQAVDHAQGREIQMSMSPEADELWAKVYGVLRRRPESLYGDMTGRAAPYVIRIAMIYALMDLSYCINLQHLKAALDVWRYCEASAKYIFGSRTGNNIADYVLDALRGSSEGLTRTDMYVDLFGKNKSSAAIGMALQTLAKLGLAYCEMRVSDNPKAKRQEERWFATPQD